MRHWAAHDAEVAWRLANPAAKVTLPDAVGHHPTSEWVVGPHQPLGELAAITNPMGKRETRWQTRKSLASASGWCGGDPRKRRLHFEPRPPVIAANPKPRRLGVF